MSGFSSQSLACGKQEIQAICSETVILGMRLDDFVNLAVSTASRIGWLVSPHRLPKISQLLLLERDESSSKAQK